jgi:LysM repeat protein
MKKTLSYTLILTILIINVKSSYSALENGPVETILYKISDKYMYVNGISKEIDPGRGTTPIIRNGRALLPVRSFIETLDGDVNWIENEQLIILYLNSKEIKLYLNKTEAYVNNEKFTIDVAPTISNSRTVLPIRFIAENFGFTVTWNEEERSILIDNQKETTSKNIPSSDLNYTIYKVSQSDTLWSISQKFNLSIQAIKDLNDLTSETIYAGQNLKIPLSNITEKDQTASTQNSNSTSDTNSDVSTNTPDTTNTRNNSSSSSNENIIEIVLNSNDNLFKNIVLNKNIYEIQILFTKIDRDNNNNPVFTTYNYNLNENNYFYPASSVKLAASILAMEKLHNLNINNLNKSTTMKISNYRNRSGETGTIENYIKKALLYSDNNSFNRLYDFLGQEYFNNTLWDKGFNKSLILHRLGDHLNYEENKYTSPISFIKSGTNLYTQQAQYNNINYSNAGLYNLKKGIGYYTGDSTIWTPKDFTNKNFMSIVTLQNILKSLIFPNYVPSSQRFNLSTDERYSIISNLRDSNIDTKFFICGGSDQIPIGTQVFNKSGIRYGHVVDNAYIANKSLGVEFLLTAVIYTNKNKIVGDNIYEYYTVGIPFLKNLSKELFNYLKNH